MGLIFVHGRDQQGKDPLILQAEWEITLRRGLESAGLRLPDGTTVTFPFYGDELDRLTKQLDMPLLEDVLTKGAFTDTREVSFRGELLAEVALSAGITDEEIQRHCVGNVKEKGPLNWEWVHAILRALDQTPLGELSIDRFTRDVYVYLTHRVVRQAIDSIVAASIPRAPSVVVGHSLGTIVAYDVLTAVGNEVSVNKFVTLGSPLGLNAIRRQLAPPPLSMPLGVRTWFNAFDSRDVVALRPLDSSSFPISPLITNKSDVNNHTRNRHGITGYLDDPEVARSIYQGLTEG